MRGQRLVHVLAVAAIGLVDAAPAAQEMDSASERIRDLADRGREQRNRGKIDESIATFEKARAIAEEADDFRSIVVLESEIGKSYERAGSYEQLLEVLHRIESHLESHDGDSAFVASVSVHVHADLAQGLHSLGRFHEALEDARRATEGLDTTREPTSRTAACNAMGTSLSALGRPAEARSWWQRARDESEDLEPSDARRTRAAIGLAQCLGELGEVPSALSLIETLLEGVEATAATPTLLDAEAYALRGQLRYYDDWSGAERDLLRSLAILREIGLDPDSTPVIHATLELSHAIRNSGRPEESASLERDICKRLLGLRGDAHPATLKASQMLAASLRDLFDRTGNRAVLQESRALLEDTARLSREYGNPNAVGVMAVLGELLLEPFDDARAAEPWLRAAVEGLEVELSRTRGIDEGARADRLQRRRLVSRHDPCELLLRCLLRLDRPEEALEVLEHSRARSLADLLARSRLDPLAQALERAENSGERETADRLRRLPAEIDAAVAEAARARMSKDGGEARERVRQAYERLKRLGSERARLTESVVPAGTIAKVAAIRGALKEEECLLAYFLGRRASFICVAGRAEGDLAWVPLVDEDSRPLTTQAAEAMVSSWSDGLSRGAGDPSRGLATTNRGADRDASTSAEAHRLFRCLVPEPIWRRLRSAKVVHLIPHGPLNWIPFEALAVESSPDGSRSPVYWIDAGPAIAYQESGTALVWARERRREQRAAASQGPVLIVANPEYASAIQSSAAHLNLPRIARVARGSAAARVGLWVGDEVVSVNGSAPDSISEAEGMLRDPSAPNEIALVVSRAGTELQVRLPRGAEGLEIATGLPTRPERGARSSGEIGLAELPGTAEEARAVCAVFAAEGDGNPSQAGRTRRLTGIEATETLLTAWAPDASILHIATHQIADPSGCAVSGRLALTAPPYPTSEDDGFVDLDDLLLHWRGKLDRCSLTVLSSCWSRGGKLVKDEGFFGLPLGLRYAGCPSIVASLWPVDDAATAELMSAFYASMQIEGSVRRLDALQQAKRSLKRVRPDPYFWSAFVWTGAPD